ncbi:hypothetical protein, partial [Escherichia coli]
MENSRIPGEHFFTTSDNTALFYRHWPALQPGAKKGNDSNLLIVFYVQIM